MEITENYFNPTPIHKTKDAWYDKRPTFCGEHTHVYAPLGHVLPFQITADNTLDTGSLSIVANMDEASFSGTFVSQQPSWDSAIFSNMQTAYTYRIQSHPDGTYLLTIEHNGLTYATGFMQQGIVLTSALTREMLTSGGTISFYDNAVVSAQICEGTIGGLLKDASISGLSVHIVDCSDNVETDITSQMDITAHSIPQTYATSKRAYCIMSAGVQLSNQSVGSHYLHIEIGNESYYSEPFLWMERGIPLTKVQYRREGAIITSDDYISFVKDGSSFYYEFYVNSPLMIPPYNFEEEVVSLDGYEFVEKRVSYRGKTLQFRCSAYFADAVRMMWHCDNVHVECHGINKRVDYTEAPSVTWNNDNHVCNVSVVFRSDTIMQTNGDTEGKGSTPATHNAAFNISFGKSFNI